MANTAPFFMEHNALNLENDDSNSEDVDEAFISR